MSGSELRTEYLIRVQFLGFRFNGWQDQPKMRTVEGMLIKTLRFILPDRKFKVLGVGRTDAKVSALDYAFELFLQGKGLADTDIFLEALNRNLPPDIRATQISKITGPFNVIQNSKQKEYAYIFSFGEKNHPFAAPFMANIIDPLDLGIMQKATSLFEGTHDFSAFTARKREGAQYVRTILGCEIIENTFLQANFFPETSYALHIKAAGFVRYQVRMIMGALIQLGKGEISMETLKRALDSPKDVQLTFVAPGSGLHLKELHLFD